MLFASKAYLAAINALLAEHSLEWTELVPENPFALQLGNAVVSALRIGCGTRFDQDHWINLFNHEKRPVQLNVVAMALNQLGHSPMLPGESWRVVANPFVIPNIEGKLESAARDILRQHGELIWLHDSRLRLENWGLADVREEDRPAQFESGQPSLHFMAELPHPKHNRPLRIEQIGRLLVMYYEHPHTIGKITAGIEPPYKYPQVAVVSEGTRPRLIVRTEQTITGGLVLCAMDPSGRHSNFGSCSQMTSDAFIRKAAEIVANYT
jgi:hypothetical protein